MPRIFSRRATVLEARNANSLLYSQRSDHILIRHHDEGWRPHQPASLRQGGFHNKWDVAVSTANIAEWRQPSLRQEGSMTALIPSHQQNCLVTCRSIFLGVAASLVFAPAIVRFTSLMPVRRLPLQILNPLGKFYRRCFYHNLDFDLKTGRSMSLVENGRIISVADAHRMVAHARAEGWRRPLRC